MPSGQGGPEGSSALLASALSTDPRGGGGVGGKGREEVSSSMLLHVFLFSDHSFKDLNVFTCLSRCNQSSQNMCNYHGV